METTNATSHRPRAARHVATLVGGVLLSCVAVGAIGAARTAAGQTTDRRICTWRPVADDVQADLGLIGTVRLADGRVEVLHRVTCSDGSFRDAWMAAID